MYEHFADKILNRILQNEHNYVPQWVIVSICKIYWIIMLQFLSTIDFIIKYAHAYAGTYVPVVLPILIVATSSSICSNLPMCSPTIPPQAFMGL